MRVARDAARSSTNHLRVGHLNVRSLTRHLDDINHLLQAARLDVLCLSESWLTETMDSSILLFPGYTIVRKDRVAAAAEELRSSTTTASPPRCWTSPVLARRLSLCGCGWRAGHSSSSAPSIGHLENLWYLPSTICMTNSRTSWQRVRQCLSSETLTSTSCSHPSRE